MTTLQRIVDRRAIGETVSTVPRHQDSKIGPATSRLLQVYYRDTVTTPDGAFMRVRALRRERTPAHEWDRPPFAGARE